MSIIKSIFKVMKNGAWDEHYFKTSSDQVVHTKTDGQASTVKEQLDGLNSALKWSDWVYVGENTLGLSLRYRYNSILVEIHVDGTLKGGYSLTGNSAGYSFPSIPQNLKPTDNIMFPIYDKKNGICVRMFVEDTNSFSIASTQDIKTVEEYVVADFMYSRL